MGMGAGAGVLVGRGIFIGPRVVGGQAEERGENKIFSTLFILKSTSNLCSSNTAVQGCNQCLRASTCVVCLKLPAVGSK